MHVSICRDISGSIRSAYSESVRRGVALPVPVQGGSPKRRRSTDRPADVAVTSHDFQRHVASRIISCAVTTRLILFPVPVLTAYFDILQPQWALRALRHAYGIRPPFPAKPEVEIWRTPHIRTRSRRLPVRSVIYYGSMSTLFDTRKVLPVWRKTGSTEIGRALSSGTTLRTSRSDAGRYCLHYTTRIR